jgi:gliding motility-associated-like protein
MIYPSVYSICTSLVLLFLPSAVFSQTPTVQDCLGAIAVCDWTFSSSTPYTGSGNIPNEVNSSISCLGNGEQNSVWYTFTTQTGGDVNFTINPNNPGNDYDWAVFNLTNAICSDIFTNPALIVACSFSPIPGPTGPNGGANPQDRPVIPVQANETYVIVITNFSPNNQGGYQLDFNASTAQIFDNIPPIIKDVVQPIPCNASSINMEFNENVSSASVTTSSLVLTGPDGAHTISSVAPASGSAYSSAFVINFSPALTVNGQYTLSIGSGVSDLCGNTASSANSTPFVFNYAGLVVDSTFSTLADCLQNNGSAGIAITGGILPLTYSWVPGGQTTPIANNLFAGNYTVTVRDQNNCQVIENVIVSNPINFAITYDQIPDTCQKGNGTVTVNANGTSGPFTYLWNLPSNTSQQLQDSLTGNDSVAVAVTDVDGCVLYDTVVVENIRNDSLLAAFTATPNPVDILYPQTKLLNTSENFATFRWDILGQTITDNLNPVVLLPDWGDYPITLYVYDVNGCSDTTKEDILVRGDLYYYIPNTFTPDENNINDRWYPRGVGFEKNSYKMTICDRWGNIMYQSNENDYGWNGNDRGGKQCPVGVYVYKITMEGYEGALPIFHGSILLIR